MPSFMFFSVFGFWGSDHKTRWIARVHFGGLLYSREGRFLFLFSSIASHRIDGESVFVKWSTIYSWYSKSCNNNIGESKDALQFKVGVSESRRRTSTCLTNWRETYNILTVISWYQKMFVLVQTESAGCHFIDNSS